MSLYRWQERDFESTSLTDDSWANVVFRSRPSTLATKTRKGFFISYFSSKRSQPVIFGWSTAQLSEKKPRNYTGQRVKKKTESIQGNKWPPTRNYTGWKLYRVKNRNHTERKTEIIQGNQVSWCHNKAIKAGLPPWRDRHWRSLKSSDLDKHTIFTIFTIVYEYYV